MPSMTNYKPDDITPSMRKYLSMPDATAQDEGTSEGAKKGWETRKGYTVAFHGSPADFEKFKLMPSRTGMGMANSIHLMENDDSWAKANYAGVDGYVYRTEIPEDNGTNYLNFDPINKKARLSLAEKFRAKYPDDEATAKWIENKPRTTMALQDRLDREQMKGMGFIGSRMRFKGLPFNPIETRIWNPDDITIVDKQKVSH